MLEIKTRREILAVMLIRLQSGRQRLSTDGVKVTSPKTGKSYG